MPWEIIKAVSKSEPVVGKLYRDRDGDLFFYLGDQDPWLEITNKGDAERRTEDYPNEPLSELHLDEWADAITEKIRSY
jgi:hypothetical protein